MEEKHGFQDGLVQRSPFHYLEPAILSESRKFRIRIIYLYNVSVTESPESVVTGWRQPAYIDDLYSLILCHLWLIVVF